MKNTKLMTLGITLVSVALALAEPTEVMRERPPLPPTPPTPPEGDGLVERDVAALAGQQAQIIATADRLAGAARSQAGAQRKMLLAQAGGGGFGGSFSPELGGATHQRTPRVLVIPKDASDAKSLAEVEEDLGVMAHILDKAISNGDKATRAMGIAVFGRMPGLAAAPQNLYIEGHGVIFLMNVNYPLLPPPAKAEKEETKEPENNEWEEARRELARPAKGQGGGDPLVLFEERFSADAVWTGKFPAADYDADKVEDLKKAVIAALKNAANIRRLKSDETVTVVVTGAEAGALTRGVKSSGAKPGPARSERVVVARASAGDRERASDAAKLIIRVRKADAEAFQTGKLDADAFQKKVTVLVF